jgi:hypothetical protein
MEGAGDAPASKASVYRNGKLLTVNELRWKRTRRAWQLESRTTRSADGLTSEEISVRSNDESVPDGSGATEAALEVKRVACASSELGKATAFAGRYVPSTPKNLGPASEGTVSLTSSSCNFSADCVKEYGEWESALQDLGMAHIATGTICGALAWLAYAGPLGFVVAPIPIGLASACAAAITTETILFSRAEKKHKDYWDCMRKNNLKQTHISKDWMLPTLTVKSSGDRRQALSDVKPTLTVDCHDPYGGGGSGGSGTEPVVTCRKETWEISYDGGASWEPIVVTVCEAT